MNEEILNNGCSIKELGDQPKFIRPIWIKLRESFLSFKLHI